MLYARVIKNIIESEPQILPYKFDGIENFNLLSDSELKVYGWYPVIIENDVYDSRIQIRTGPSYYLINDKLMYSYSLIDIDFSEVLSTKLKELASKRFEVETGGVDVGGSIILTDRESQAQITGAYNAAKNGLLSTLNFKASSGWITLTAAEMIAIGEAVYAHVQRCFNIEKQHSEAISLLTTAKEVADYDINTLW